MLRQYVNLTDPKYFCNKSWTLSFNVNTKSWVSFHSYIPNFYIAENNIFYSGLNEGCDLHAIAVQELPNPTTTTTTTVILNCNLSGEATYIPPATTTTSTTSTTSTTTTIAPPPGCDLVAGSVHRITDCTLGGGTVIVVTTTTTTTTIFYCSITAGTVHRVTDCAIGSGTVIITT